MNSQAFLSLLQSEYDFTRANSILSETNLKNCWKQWLTAELVHMFNQLSCHSGEQSFITQTDVHYPALIKTDKDPAYLSYQTGKPATAVSEKRHGSRCDFSVTQGNKTLYCEIRGANKTLFAKNKDLGKFSADIERIEALKAANNELNIFSIFVFYGALSGKEIEAFKPMDNSTRTSYVLDSGLTGSTSIARLSHMDRNGDDRVCVAVFSV